MAEVSSLTVGQVFGSIDDAKASVNAYNEANFTNFVVETNNKKSLVYFCRHAIERKSRNGGKRPNQHFIFSSWWNETCTKEKQIEDIWLCCAIAWEENI